MVGYFLTLPCRNFSGKKQDVLDKNLMASLLQDLPAKEPSGILREVAYTQGHCRMYPQTFTKLLVALRTSTLLVWLLV